MIQPGELLFAWSGNRGTSFGSFIWDRPFPAYLNQHIFKLTGYSVSRRFFYYLLRAVTAHVEEMTHGIIGLVHITRPELGAIVVPVPPAPEQEATAGYLDRCCGETEEAISRARREIDLVREYRTRLITDIVTGKVDIRGVELRPVDGTDFAESVDPDEWVKPTDPDETGEAAHADE